MKKRLFLISGILLIIISFAFLLYPSLSNFINSAFSKSVIDNYTQNVKAVSAADKKNYLSAAETYNRKLKEKVANFSFSTDSYIDGYDDILNFEGIIGYLEIPKINLSIPIYHGSDESVLTKGAAHIPNTAFPVGGIGNHTVISAHTAYPTQVFFDDLPELECGDCIYIKILDEVLCYTVCDKNIVEPNDTSLLNVDNSKDLLSLITCYPYAVNSHRLIVTAERASSDKDNASAAVNQTNSRSSNNTLLIITAAFICIGVIIIFIIVIIIKSKNGGTK